jgi:hypothetical protein
MMVSKNYKGGCTKLVYVSHAVRTAKTCLRTLEDAVGKFCLLFREAAFQYMLA